MKVNPAFLTITFMTALTAVTGYVYFRWEAITARSYRRHGGKPYAQGEKGLALLAFIFSVIATIAVVTLVVLK
jgi:hypothetical protein